MLIAAALVLVLASTAGLVIHMLTYRSLEIREEFLKLLDPSLAVVQLKPINGDVYLLGYTRGDSSVVIYRYSPQSRALSSVIWGFEGNTTVYPLKLIPSGDKILVPSLIGDRRHLLVLTYTKDLRLVSREQYSVGEILLVSSVETADSASVVVGARYRTGYRLQYYVGLIDPGSRQVREVMVWGTSDVDYLVEAYAVDSLLYAIGNSTVEGSVVYVINSRGWSVEASVKLPATPLKSIVNGVEFTSLLNINTTYYLCTITPLTYKLTCTEIAKPQLESYQVFSYSFWRDYLILLGRGYRADTKTIDALALFYHATRPGGLSLEKLLWISGEGVNSVLFDGATSGDDLVVVGYAGSTPFIAHYTLRVQSFNPLVVITHATALALGAVILARELLLKRREHASQQSIVSPLSPPLRNPP